MIGDLTAAQDAVFVVLFAHVDRALAATGSDNTLHLVYYEPEEAAKAVCSVRVLG